MSDLSLQDSVDYVNTTRIKKDETDGKENIKDYKSNHGK